VLVNGVAAHSKLGNQCCKGFAIARVSGKIIGGGLSGKPFGVDSAGGFFIGGVGLVVHCGHPLHRCQFGALRVQHLHQFADFVIGLASHPRRIDG
jgi:hypothetical protein